jgi:hypothetical protein
MCGARKERESARAHERARESERASASASERASERARKRERGIVEREAGMEGGKIKGAGAGALGGKT